MNFCRRFFTAAVISFVAGLANAETIAPQDAVNHVGQSVVVEGVVSQVSVSGRGTTFINFGGRFPNHVFYAVIFRDNADLFPGVHNLEGMPVAISGRIQMYEGKPEIILNSPSQLEAR